MGQIEMGEELEMGIRHGHGLSKHCQSDFPPPHSPRHLSFDSPLSTLDSTPGTCTRSSCLWPAHLIFDIIDNPHATPWPKPFWPHLNVSFCLSSLFSCCFLHFVCFKLRFGFVFVSFVPTRFMNMYELC